jgi:hypothetical protein
LLASASKPRHSARTRLNRVRSRVSGAAAARVKMFKKLSSAAKAIRVVAALLAFAAASNFLTCGRVACGAAGAPPTPPTPYRPSALAATQAGLYATRRSDATPGRVSRPGPESGFPETGPDSDPAADPPDVQSRATCPRRRGG